MAQVLIRAARAEDVAVVLELYAEVDELHRAAHPDLYGSPIPVRDAAGFEKEMAEPHVGVLVAQTASGDVVGFAQLFELQTPEGRPLRPRRYCLMDALGVAAAHRRQGVGKALMQAAEEWAKARGLESIEVTVWAFNDSARRAYEQQGFTTLRQYLRKPLVSPH